ncbi:hypothetical protein [Leuconostoc citreum]|uniref:hypothetical protein n=2 Tax=Leuconostoc citreum TaxID=33964 RepID=UPI0021824175|nr:hypothetical protein [Leuconostoc citreum]MCS8594618.1 hypothetical protein [Leuconostoc citreum]MCT3059034.1 hypothetical protein [Leuconostoc citreum]MCT3078286.1 hypothetical protein [Leuconostoc citreum]MCT3080417.1 hypothetical protein [Leuconostoc citreum]MCT3082844.1 hypothetical protein [Leuconostoc citreum]
MNNIQMKNEIPDNNNDTVKLAFSVTFDDGTTISDGAIVISRADWLNMTGQEKLSKIADVISKKMSGTKGE